MKHVIELTPSEVQTAIQEWLKEEYPALMTAKSKLDYVSCAVVVDKGTGGATASLITARIPSDDR